MMQISIEDKPRPEDCDFVRNRLHEHNATIVGPDNYAPLAIFVRGRYGLNSRRPVGGDVYLFSADSSLPDEWEWIGTVGSEADAIFSFSWISHSSIAKIDPELRTFLTREYIPELFIQQSLLER